jgi:hypothetical protein
MRKIGVAIAAAMVSTVVVGQDVSKEIWLGQMSTALPNYFCASQQFFRQCFNVGEVQCKMIAKEATDACLRQYEEKIPSKLKQPADGTFWGQQVGMCAGNAYEIALINQRINSSKCNNVDNWR